MCISIVYRETSSVHRTYHLLLVWVSTNPGVDSSRAEPPRSFVASKQAPSFCYLLLLLITITVTVHPQCLRKLLHSFIHSLHWCLLFFTIVSINQIAFHVKQKLFIVGFSINIQKLFRNVNEIIKKYNNLNYSVSIYFWYNLKNFTFLCFQHLYEDKNYKNIYIPRF